MKMDSEVSAASNRDRALNAALEIVGAEGVHGLTHGRVDSAAGLPKGSTSNHFRTRAALIHATVDHLVSAEQNAFTAGADLKTVEDLVDALTAFVPDANGTHRTLAAARVAFFVEAFHDANVRSVLTDARAHIDTWAVQILESLKFPEPDTAARIILTYVDGVILHTLTFGSNHDIRLDIHAVVHSCLPGECNAAPVTPAVVRSADIAETTRTSGQSPG